MHWSIWTRKARKGSGGGKNAKSYQSPKHAERTRGIGVPQGGNCTLIKDLYCRRSTSVLRTLVHLDSQSKEGESHHENARIPYKSCVGRQIPTFKSTHFGVHVMQWTLALQRQTENEHEKSRKNPKYKPFSGVLRLPQARRASTSRKKLGHSSSLIHVKSITPRSYLHPPQLARNFLWGNRKTLFCYLCGFGGYAGLAGTRVWRVCGFGG